MESFAPITNKKIKRDCQKAAAPYLSRYAINEGSNNA